MSLFTLAIIVNPVQGFMNSVLQVRRWGERKVPTISGFCAMYVRIDVRLNVFSFFYIVETGVNGKKQD